MKNKALLILAVLACLCVGLVAHAATNMPVRVVIVKFGRPPKEKMDITDTNAISRIVALFPGYEKQPDFGDGHWMTEYTVELDLADGQKRDILVADNEWSAGSEDYTPLKTNWERFLLQMTNSWTTNTANKASEPSVAPAPQVQR